MTTILLQNVRKRWPLTDQQSVNSQAVNGTFQVGSCSDLVDGGFLLLKVKLLELPGLLMFPVLQDLQHI